MFGQMLLENSETIYRKTKKSSENELEELEKKKKRNFMLRNKKYLYNYKLLD